MSEEVDALLMRGLPPYGQMSYGELWEAYGVLVDGFRRHSEELGHMRARLAESEKRAKSVSEDLQESTRCGRAQAALTESLRKAPHERRLSWRERLTGRAKMTFVIGNG